MLRILGCWLHSQRLGRHRGLVSCLERLEEARSGSLSWKMIEPLNALLILVVYNACFSELSHQDEWNAWTIRVLQKRYFSMV